MHNPLLINLTTLIKINTSHSTDSSETPVNIYQIVRLATVKVSFIALLSLLLSKAVCNVHLAKSMRLIFRNRDSETPPPPSHGRTLTITFHIPKNPPPTKLLSGQRKLKAGKRKSVATKLLSGNVGCVEQKIYIYIQGVPGGKDLTSGECSLGQTIPI